MKMKNKLLKWTVAAASVLAFAQNVGAYNPFHGTPFVIPGRIEAEDFDKGGYISQPSSVEENDYRTEKVNIKTLPNGSIFLEPSYKSEFLYSVDVQYSGEYDLKVLWSNTVLKYTLECDGKELFDPSSDSRESNDCSAVYEHNIPVVLSKGSHVLKLKTQERNIINLNKIDAFEFTLRKKNDNPLFCESVFDSLKLHSNGSLIGRLYAYAQTDAYRGKRCVVADTIPLNLNWGGLRPECASDSNIVYTPAQKGANYTGVIKWTIPELTETPQKKVVTFAVSPKWEGDISKQTIKNTVWASSEGKTSSSSYKLEVTKPEQEPFEGGPAHIPGTIDLTEFDKGGSGNSYFDYDETNTAMNGTRAEQWVETGVLAGRNYVEGEEGEWLEYTVNVEASDFYLWKLVSLNRVDGKFSVELDGKTIIAETKITNGSEADSDTISGTTPELKKGKHVLRFNFGKNSNGVKVENLIFERSQKVQTPFHGTPLTIPGRIEAEDFDEGGYGVAYRSAHSIGNDYRLEDFEMNVVQDSNGAKSRWLTCIGGGWMEYTVDVKQTDLYELFVYYDGFTDNFHELGSYTIKIDDKTIYTKSDEDKKESNKGKGFIHSGFVELKKGTHVLRFEANKISWQIELDRFVFVKNTNEELKRTPFHGTPLAIPGRIEAEDFDKGVQDVVYFCSTPADNNYRSAKVKIDTLKNGAKALVYSSTDWYEYTVDIKRGGLYTIKVPLKEFSFMLNSYLELDGQAITGNFYGFTMDSTVVFENIYLPKGIHVLRLVGNIYDWEFSVGSETLDAFEFTLTDTLRCEECTLTYKVSGIDKTKTSNVLDISLKVKDSKYKFNASPKIDAVVYDTVPLGFLAGNFSLSDTSGSSFTYKPAPKGAAYGGFIQWTLTALPESGENALNYTLSPIWEEGESSKVYHFSSQMITPYDTIAKIDLYTVKKPTRSSYNGVDRVIPGHIEAEHFDAGGQNISYFDNDFGNTCKNPFRADDWVETKKDSGGLVIASEGEWLEYTVNVEANGYYFWYLRCNNASKGYFEAKLDGETIIYSTMISNAGISSSDTVFGTTMKLTEGKHILRITFGENSTGAAVDWMEFKRVDTSTSPFKGEPFAVPGLIEAEEFDKGGNGLAYNSPKGSLNSLRPEKVAMQEKGILVHNGDWFKYSIDVKETNDYDISTIYTGYGRIKGYHLELDGKTLVPVDSLTFVKYEQEPGGPYFQNETRRYRLKKGKHELKLVLEGDAKSNASGIFDRFVFVLSDSSDLWKKTPNIAKKAEKQSDLVTFNLSFKIDGASCNKSEYNFGKDVQVVDTIPLYFSWGGFVSDSTLGYKAEYQAAPKGADYTGIVKWTAPEAPINREGKIAYTVTPNWLGAQTSIISETKAWMTVEKKTASFSVCKVQLQRPTCIKMTADLKMQYRNNSVVYTLSFSSNQQASSNQKENVNHNVLILDTIPLNLAWGGFKTDSTLGYHAEYVPAADGADFTGIVKWTAPEISGFAKGEISFITFPKWIAQERTMDLVNTVWMTSDDEGLSIATAENQASNPYQTPYLGKVNMIPGIIEAERYDNGGNYVAYFTHSIENNGTDKLRKDELFDDYGADGGYVLGKGGEWLEYTVFIENTDHYFWYLRCPNEAKGHFKAELDGELIIPESMISNAGISSSDTVFGTTQKLEEGRHVLRITFANDCEAAAIDWIKFEAVSPVLKRPFKGEPLAIPGRIEAEDFDKGGAGLAFYSPIAGGNNAGYRTEMVDISSARGGDRYMLDAYNGDWFEYSVNIQESGIYDLTVFYSELSFNEYSFELDGEVFMEPQWLAKPDDYIYVPHARLYTKNTSVELEKGKHTLRLVMDSDDSEAYERARIDAFEFELKNSSADVANTPSTPVLFPLTANVFAIDGRLLGKVTVPSASTLQMAETLKDAGYRRGTYVLKADGFSKLVICK